jgi:hypothetical protein
VIRRERDPADEERAAARLVVEPVRAPTTDTSLANLIAVAVVLLAIVVLKPWGFGAPLPTPAALAAPFTPAPATPVPTEDRTADGLAAPICLGTGAWRITSLETWQTQDVRVWRAITPVETASGPLDPGIPSVTIVALRLAGLGWCAPAFGPDRPAGPAEVTAWSVRGTEAIPLQLRQTLPADGVTPIAALYVPLTLCPEPTICAPLLPAPVPRAWETERVVFRYRDTATGRQDWLAADILILEPSAAPSLPAR